MSHRFLIVEVPNVRSEYAGEACHAVREDDLGGAGGESSEVLGGLGSWGVAGREDRGRGRFCLSLG